MKFSKITGWVLLAIGLVVIFWALYSSYNTFTGKAAIPEIFKIEKEEPALSQEDKTEPTSQEELQKEMEEMIEKQIKEMIPPEFLAKLLNLMSWSIFAGILIFGGGRIAGIGIRLLKG